MSIHYSAFVVSILEEDSDRRDRLRRTSAICGPDFSSERCALEALRAFKETGTESGRTLSDASL
jgi:hypothetical protein